MLKEKLWKFKEKLQRNMSECVLHVLPRRLSPGFVFSATLGDGISRTTPNSTFSLPSSYIYYISEYRVEVNGARLGARV